MDSSLSREGGQTCEREDVEDGEREDVEDTYGKEGGNVRWGPEREGVKLLKGCTCEVGALVGGIRLDTDGDLDLAEGSRGDRPVLREDTG